MDSAYTAAYADLYRRHWWWRVREEILLREIAFLCRNSCGAARILDVGCGAGLFFDALQRFGHVEGIESDRIAVESAGRWRDRIFEGQLDGSFKPAAPYDLILILDVLEHVSDPEGMLRHAAAVLEPAGRIVITVPAFNWLWTRHDDINHHQRRYTRAEMRRTIRKAGLVLTDCRYLFPSLVVPKAFVRLRETLVPGPPALPDIPRPAINAALQGWLRAEYAVAQWAPFGTSLIAIVERPRTS